ASPFCTSSSHCSPPSFFHTILRPPRSTLFPYTTLFRSQTATSPQRHSRIGVANRAAWGSPSVPPIARCAMPADKQVGPARAPVEGRRRRAPAVVSAIPSGNELAPPAWDHTPVVNIQPGRHSGRRRPVVDGRGG